MAESVLDYEKRPIRYNSIDGIDEMFIGLFLLSSTVLMHAVNVAPERSIWHLNYAVLIANALLLIVFLLGRKVLKDRITYRRTGYVKYRYSKVRSAIGAVVGFGLAVVVVLSLLAWGRPPDREGSLILVGSLLWAAFYAYFYIHVPKMYRLWRWLIAVAIAAGPLSFYSLLRQVHDISTLSAGIPGVFFLISGVTAFVSYLRNTKPAEAQSQELQ